MQIDDAGNDAAAADVEDLLRPRGIEIGRNLGDPPFRHGHVRHPVQTACGIHHTPVLDEHIVAIRHCAPPSFSPRRDVSFSTSAYL